MSIKTYQVVNEKELDVKRFKLPLVINVPCPNCKTINELDFEKCTMDYPVINKQGQVYVYCKDCEDFFEQKITLRIAVDIS